VAVCAVQGGLSSRAYFEPADPLSLVTLMDRIKMSAKKKQKEANDRYRERHDPSTGGHAGGVASSKPTLESRNNPRRKFQEYFQSKQQAAVMLDEYLASHERCKEEQVCQCNNYYNNNGVTLVSLIGGENEVAGAYSSSAQ
jgi:hypothetical protein